MLVRMLTDVAGELDGAPLPGKGELVDAPESLALGLIEDGKAELPTQAKAKA